MDLGVRPQHKMLWDDDLGPETDVDNPEVPRDSRPESTQGGIVDGSSESSEEEEEWKYIKGATKPEAKKETDEQSDSKSQLNPNASEFIPGVEKLSAFDKDDFIAASPNVCKVNEKNLEDMDVPSESEFDLDISSRACDLEPATDDDFGSTLVSGVAEKVEMGGNIIEGISLILTPQKADTNPFAADMDSKTGDDKVDFVSDYFGKSGLDFKPFESVTPQESDGSKVLNSVSEEISSHFNFINSHLDSNEHCRSEESEKERNQLEIKEPESPAHSEKCGNGLPDHQEDDQIVVSRSEVEISSVVTVSKDSGVDGVAEFVCNISEKISEPNILCYSRDDEFRLTVDNGDSALSIKSTETKIADPSDLDFKKCVSDSVSENTGGSGVFDIGEEASKKLNQLDQENIANEVSSALSELHLEPSPAQVNVVDSDKKIAGSENAAFSNDFHVHSDSFDVGVNHSTTEPVPSHVDSDEDDADSDKNSVKVVDVDNAFSLNIHGVECKNKTVEMNAEDVKHDEDHSKFSFVEVESNINDKDINQHTQPQLELADTIGPNSFSFSQPYEVVEEIHGMTATNFLQKYDIMTTSMHKSFEQDSSFEFINESAVKEIIHDESSSRNQVLSAPVDASEATLGSELKNGVVHDDPVVTQPSTNGLISIDGSLENTETESAIVESHAVPVSSEPDLVFVEQICPTVEVKSDEASPVNKDVNILEMTAVSGGAAIATALGAAAVANQLISETKDNKSVDAKISSKSPATKSAVNKKPASPASKPTTLKSTVKEPLSKSAPLALKAKMTTAPKASNTTSVASRTKPSSLTAKPASTAAKPSVAKTSAKPAVAPITRVPPKHNTSAAASSKPAVPAAKTATRPSTAPTKTSTTLSKSAAPSKALSSTARVPTTTVKKLPATSARPAALTKTTSVESKVTAKPPSRTGVALTAKPSAPKTSSTVAAKPPFKLGSLTAPSSKPKATSPTKPAPIKAKSPLAAPKRPISSVKKTSAVLDKNAKNTVKSVPKDTAQKEIIASETQNVQEDVSATTTNGHHIENGNVTPIEEIPSHII